MSITKYVPTLIKVLGKPCPVCGKTSYSRGGTHPQCAVRLVDARLALKAKRK